MRRDTSRIWLTAMAIVLFFATLLVAALAFRPLPLVIWNASDSVPIGWYWVERRQPKIGEIAVVLPPEWVQLYASSRGYLPDDVWLLKPVLAVSSATVCRFGSFVFVNGKQVARAKTRDRQHRVLPVWKGCRVLQSDDVFLLAKPRNSFDSRYFGPITRTHIAGVATRFCLSCIWNIHTH
jgi:conjugative transfer signal peptidase TraF